MTTIKEIAVLAETSIATVSRVINNDPHVSEPMRRKVKQIIETVDYIPKKSIKMKSHSKKRILVMLPSLDNPYFFAVLKGVENGAFINGVESIICFTHRNYKTEKKYLDMLINNEVDGVILFTSSIQNDELNSLSSKYPIIQCGAMAEGTSISYASIDDIVAAYDAATFLIQLGNQNIAFISSSYDYPFNRKRLLGYTNALNDNGIPFNSKYMKKCENTYLDGYNSMKELMSLPKPPTAIFSYSDLTALGVLGYMYDHKIIPGKDIDVIGFDGTYLSESLSPQLTVIEQPAYDLGRTAFKMLTERIEDTDFITQKIILPHKLIIRGTTRQK